MADRQGLRLEKSRRKDPRAIDYESYMLVDAERDAAVLGAEPHAYSATIEDVAVWLEEPLPANQRKRR